MIETSQYKRPWRDTDANITEHQFRAATDQEALESWLLDRLEAALRDQPVRRPQPIRALAETLSADPKVRAVAEVLSGSGTFDLEVLLADLALKEAVPSATCQRYTEKGILTRRTWEKTWDLQRREDAGESLTIEAPPKYDQKDFENAAVLWRLRGKLDVPKERFIAYPTATPPPGATPRVGATLGWAGWNALEHLQALLLLWQDEMALHGHHLLSRTTRDELEAPTAPPTAHDRLAADTAARDRLFPLLQTLTDLLPWIAQWHDEDGQTARDYEDYLTEESRKLGVSLHEAHLYRRPTRDSRPRPTPRRPVSPSATPPHDPATLESAVLQAIRDLDEGAGTPLSTLAEHLSLPPATLKKPIDSLLAQSLLIERKKRPRLLSAV